MPEIHPTAVIDPRAKLADDVRVGAFTLVQGPVTIGAGTRVLHRVTLQGPLAIGAGNVLYPNVCIGYAPQDRKYDPQREGAGVVIGDRNILREGVTIHRATGDRPTTVGDDNYLMVNAHLGHDVVMGSRNTLGNGTLLGGHVAVADAVIFGGNAAVHQFCRVGRLAMLAGLAGVTQDVPPFCVVYATRTVGSLNIVGLRRAGLRGHIGALKRAFALLLRSKLPRPAAVERIRAELGDDPLCAELAEFAAASKRGVTPYGGSRDAAHAGEPAVGSE